MLPYGFTRTYAKCRTHRAYGKKKIHVEIEVKNHKRGRQWDRSEINEPS